MRHRPVSVDVSQSAKSHSLPDCWVQRPEIGGASERFWGLKGFGDWGLRVIRVWQQCCVAEMLKGIAALIRGSKQRSLRGTPCFQVPGAPCRCSEAEVKVAAAHNPRPVLEG